MRSDFSEGGKVSDVKVPATTTKKLLSFDNFQQPVTYKYIIDDPM